MLLKKFKVLVTSISFTNLHPGVVFKISTQKNYYLKLFFRKQGIIKNFWNLFIAKYDYCMTKKITQLTRR